MTHFNYRKFFRSFHYAIRGLITLVETEQNAKFHLFATICVGIAAQYFHLSRMEAVIVFFSVVLVFVTEITNTAIEKLLDLIHPEEHSQIAYIKDALAGAVLISAVIAGVVGSLIFWPYISRLI